MRSKIVSPLDGMHSPLGPVLGFSPKSLFAAGESGVWFDPSDLSTMFQDSVGTTPVTAVGQPVGLILDKSKGLAIGAELFSTFSTVTSPWAGGFGTWSINGSQGVNSDLSISGFYGAGTFYVTTFTLSGVSGGTVTVFAGEGSGVSLGNGTYTYRRAATQSYLIIRAGAGVSATVSGVSVKTLAGNHASQSTTTSRPVLSARVNLLTYSEQFDNAAWAKTSSTVTADAATAPNGTSTADLIQFSGTGGRIGYVVPLTSGVSFTFSIWIKVASGTRDYQITDNAATPAVLGTITATTSWQRLSVTFSGTGQGAIRLVDNNASGFVDTYIWGADLRHTNQNSLPYQRIVTGTTNDYDTSGFPYYLSFDGVDDSLATASINPGSVDKVQVFAGVRKLSDAAQAVVAEWGNGTGNGTFFVAAPRSAASASYGFNSKGTVAIDATSPLTFAAPITNVISGIGDISAPSATLRINGSQSANSTLSQGTGNYGSNILYIGRRGGSTLPFNGNIYGLIARFSAANLNATTIANTESYMNKKTKAY